MNEDNTQKLDKLPGIDILNKYQPDIKAVDESINVEVRKKITHFDRQELFSLGWKYINDLTFSLNLNLI